MFWLSKEGSTCNYLPWLEGRRRVEFGWCSVGDGDFLVVHVDYEYNDMIVFRKLIKYDWETENDSPFGFYVFLQNVWTAFLRYRVVVLHETFSFPLLLLLFLFLLPHHFLLSLLQSLVLTSPFKIHNQVWVPYPSCIQDFSVLLIFLPLQHFLFVLTISIHIMHGTIITLRLRSLILTQMILPFSSKDGKNLNDQFMGE